MDNLEEGGVQMDNLGEKRGVGQNIYSCYAEATGGWGGGGALPTLAHPFVIQLLAWVCTWPE